MMRYFLLFTISGTVTTFVILTYFVFVHFWGIFYLLLFECLKFWIFCFNLHHKTNLYCAKDIRHKQHKFTLTIYNKCPNDQMDKS